MLRGISPIISPELIKVLMEMGHGDELILADANFPAAGYAQRLVRGDGISIPALLAAILPLFPLDYYVEFPVALMNIAPNIPNKPVIWEDYRKIVKANEPNFKDFEYMERFAFYERAKKAYAILATGELATYANVILKKGVIKP